ncbi:MAG: hypothetical protein M9958_10535 [Chitinophagales bacterium]|nr:hypothetical protein [Chitinophagales bacterium]
MRYFLFFILFNWVTIQVAQAGDENDSISSIEILKDFVYTPCMEEIRQNKKINVNADYFCSCLFESFISIIKESGVSFDDMDAIVALSGSEDYHKRGIACAEASNNEILKEEYLFKKGCYKGLKKNFSRNKEKRNNVCDCAYAKYKDIGISFVEINKLPEETRSELMQKILKECTEYEIQKGIK